jgi:hypothetical protein
MPQLVILKMVWKAVSPTIKEGVLKYIREDLKPKVKATPNPVDDVLIDIIEDLIEQL